MDLLVILAIAVPIGAAIGYFLRGGSISDDDIDDNLDDDNDNDNDNYNGDSDSDGGDGGD